MFKKLIIVTAFLTMFFVFVPTQAQDKDVIKLNGWAAQGGIKYDDGLILSCGLWKRLNGNLWNLSYLDLGNNAANADIEFGYLLNFNFITNSDKFKIFLLAGPNADWQNISPDDSMNTIAYLVGAGGGIFMYDFNGHFNIWGSAKYKFSLETNSFVNSYRFGLGCAYFF